MIHMYGYIYIMGSIEGPWYITKSLLYTCNGIYLNLDCVYEIVSLKRESYVFRPYTYKKFCRRAASRSSDCIVTVGLAGRSFDSDFRLLGIVRVCFLQCVHEIDTLKIKGIPSHSYLSVDYLLQWRMFHLLDERHNKSPLKRIKVIWRALVCIYKQFY